MNPHVRNGIINQINHLKSLAQNGIPHSTIESELDKLERMVLDYKPRRIDFTGMNSRSLYNIVSFDDLTPKQQVAYALHHLVEHDKTHLALLNLVNAVVGDAVSRMPKWWEQYVIDIDLEGTIEAHKDLVPA